MSQSLGACWACPGLRGPSKVVKSAVNECFALRDVKGATDGIAMFANVKATTENLDSGDLLTKVRRDFSDAPQAPFREDAQKTRHLFQAPSVSFIEVANRETSPALFHLEPGGPMLKIHPLPPGDATEIPPLAMVKRDAIDAYQVQMAAHQLLRVAGRVLGAQASAKEQFSFISGILRGPLLSASKAPLDAHIPLGIAALRVAVFEALFS